MSIRIIILVSLLCCLPNPIYAADFDSATLSLSWGTPFVGIILSIAILPLVIPTIWHRHYGKIVTIWVLLFMIPFVIIFGVDSIVALLSHAVFEEFIPFILLLLALFTVSGGILIDGHLQGSPKLNLILLSIGTLLASIMGTTGAAMLMIRPIIRANHHRHHKVHVIIFFIFLVANIGGGLTPLGDPPLFIGFLKGISFFWTLKYMLLPVLLTSILLLMVFYMIDNYYYQQQIHMPNQKKLKQKTITIKGKQNCILLVAIVGSVLLSGMWQSDIHLTILGSHLSLPNICRDLLLLIITVISIIITPKQIRAANQFNWEPMLEVAKLFIGIFITIVPVIAILRAGHGGGLSSVVSVVTSESGEPINSMYFWLSGLLSGFLDNAPTYLVFFNLASGDANTLMGPLSTTLLAISMGSVFMGALTYIGNAPNFMVKSIATQQQINMPSFFGYMKWSVSILVPILMINALIFFIL